MKTLLRILIILILFIPSISLKAQYPTIKKLNNDTVSIFDTQGTKVLAKVCSDRAYLIAVKDSTTKVMNNQSIIIYNDSISKYNKDAQLHYKDSIINNYKSEVGLYTDIIDECEQEIKTKNTSLIIHKIIIVILTVIAILK